MSKDLKRAEIIAKGLVQGVGFRWFVLKHAQQFGLKGYTKNLFTGEVLTVAEGEQFLLEELFNKIKIGPMHADVRDISVKWCEAKNEFTNFEIRH
ncbi:putative acylphosphate phosphohydrolase [hydrocarbon metagenome]|uniref:Putative acylphosphate phosphohydrolase n=1 Tax=hydrocarbon metagenome TaxID=938273 RepID=A0A0W8FYT2_9ZZZZ